MATISNPFVMEVPRKLTDEELVNAIRQDIIGELEARWCRPAASRDPC